MKSTSAIGNSLLLGLLGALGTVVVVSVAWTVTFGADPATLITAAASGWASTKVLGLL